MGTLPVVYKKTSDSGGKQVGACEGGGGGGRGYKIVYDLSIL